MQIQVAGVDWRIEFKGEETAGKNLIISAGKVILFGRHTVVCKDRKL